ncbi:MAG: hypothetical protein JNK11_03300 [Alphaproteobacteria bacterium]|nr:hypothetical protein [Alphaproteobacteria bacterium]
MHDDQAPQPPPNWQRRRRPPRHGRVASAGRIVAIAVGLMLAYMALTGRLDGAWRALVGG